MKPWTAEWNRKRDAKYNMDLVFPKGKRGRKPKPRIPHIAWSQSKAQTARQMLEHLGK